VVANPPFSSKNWGHERFKTSGDPYGRVKHLPPKSHGELAFVQHMIASLDDDGMLAVVLPNGCFFRMGAELAVRKELIDRDLVEAIVQLPVDLFYGAGIPACILVCNRAKAHERRGRVLMINASDLFERRDTKNALTLDGIAMITTAFKTGDAESGSVTSVPCEEIVARSYNLTVRRYASPNSDDAQGAAAGIEDAVAAYRDARAAREAAEARLDHTLASLEESVE
jgi:type I restriction enzyme M protein